MGLIFQSVQYPLFQIGTIHFKESISVLNDIDYLLNKEKYTSIPKKIKILINEEEKEILAKLDINYDKNLKFTIITNNKNIKESTKEKVISGFRCLYDMSLDITNFLIRENITSDLKPQSFFEERLIHFLSYSFFKNNESILPRSSKRNIKNIFPVLFGDGLIIFEIVQQFNFVGNSEFNDMFLWKINISTIKHGSILLLKEDDYLWC